MLIVRWCRTSSKLKLQNWSLKIISKKVLTSWNTYEIIKMFDDVGQKIALSKLKHDLLPIGHPIWSTRYMLSLVIRCKYMYHYTRYSEGVSSNSRDGVKLSVAGAWYQLTSYSFVGYKKVLMKVKKHPWKQVHSD